MGKGLTRAIDISKKAEFDARKQRHHEAWSYFDKGNLDKSIELFRENVDWSLKNLGQEHETTVCDQESLAFTLNELGGDNYNEASKLDETALNTRAKAEGLSPPSKDYLHTQWNLAKDHIGRRNIRKAVKILQENYEHRLKHPDFGVDHETTLKVGHDLAGALHRSRDYENARKINETILEGRIRLKRPADEIILSRNALAGNLAKLKAIEEKQQKQKKEEEKQAKLAARNEAQWKEAEALLAAKKIENHKQFDRAESSNDTKRESWKTSHTQTPFEKSQPIPIPKISFNHVPPKSQSLPKSDPESLTWKFDSKKSEGKIAAGTSWDNKKGGWGATNNWNDSQTTAESENPNNSRRRRGISQGNRPASMHIDFRHVSSSDALSQISTLNPSHIVQGETPSRRPSAASLTPNGSVPKSSQVDSKKSPTMGIPSKKTIPQTAELSRSRSQSNRRDKPVAPPRAKSSSPRRDQKPKVKSDEDAEEIFYFPRLFEARDGKDDEQINHAVDAWFYSLRTKTQKLLDPMRRCDGRKIRIAILDTGIDLSHEDFQVHPQQESNNPRIKKVEDFVDQAGNGIDTCGHGTHCVGLIHKIAPEADIYVARVARDFKSGLEADAVAKAINRACNSGKDKDGKANWNVDIITMSFGFPHLSEPLRIVQKEIEAALTKPVLIFAAASNNGDREDVTFPAWIPNVICINSANANGTPSDFNPDPIAGKNFSILGENVKSAWIGKGYKHMSGTSVATPIAAAVAALVLEFALQNDPPSVLKHHLNDLKSFTGMTEVFASMVKKNGTYRNLVPWQLLGGDRGIVSGRIRHQLRMFTQ